jgi:hypothetical protein
VVNQLAAAVVKACAKCTVYLQKISTMFGGIWLQGAQIKTTHNTLIMAPEVSQFVRIG